LVKAIITVGVELTPAPAWPGSAAAQTPALPGPVVETCPALFYVLHDDRIGPLTLAAGPYRITTFGSGPPDCHAASDLLRQFLRLPASNLPAPWSLDVSEASFWRGPGRTNGFRVKESV
jgi:hypothetical protein